MRTSSTRPEYVALSYCWGSTQHSALTTSQNFAERLKGLSEKSLPKTIRDAILMTRELGIRYLWVDALCIIQPTDGNSSDWDIESLCMGTYYQNAILTFAAAMGSDSSDGLWREKIVLQSGGLTPGSYSSTFRSIFTMQNRKEQKPMRATKRDSNWRKDVQRSTLRGRGWALQELILSLRVVYWTPDGMYWDCCSSIASESKPDTLSFNEYDQLDPVREMRLHFARARHRQHNADVLDRWYGIVAHYSCMQLSYASDTLPAISGIAKAVQGSTPLAAMEYAAGIWVNSQDPQLSWYDLAWRIAPSSIASHAPKTSESSYIAPSWSWASAGAPIICPDRGRQQNSPNRGTADVHFKILDIKLRLSGEDTMGQLRSGIMYLRGSTSISFKATIRPTKDPHHWFDGEWSHRNERSKRTNFYFDKKLVPEEIQAQTLLQELDEEEDLGISMDVICMVIGHLGGRQYGILLKTLPGYDARFRRIGMLQRHKTNTFESTKIVDIELV